MTLRKFLGEIKYRIAMAKKPDGYCCFCEARDERAKKGWPFFSTHEIVKEFNHWLVMLNDYPGDKIFKRHLIAFPKRHVEMAEMTKEENEEYVDMVMPYLNANADIIFNNTIKRQSMPGHYHRHAGVFKTSWTDKLIPHIVNLYFILFGKKTNYFAELEEDDLFNERTNNLIKNN